MLIQWNINQMLKNQYHKICGKMDRTRKNNIQCYVTLIQKINMIYTQLYV